MRIRVEFEDKQLFSAKHSLPAEIYTGETPDTEDG
jgi:hypothetical protein